jgi:hypothetical protein
MSQQNINHVQNLSHDTPISSDDDEKDEVKQLDLLNDLQDKLCITSDDDSGEDLVDSLNLDDSSIQTKKSRGIKSKDWAEQIKSQGCRCLVCNKLFNSTYNRPVWDHDHHLELALLGNSRSNIKAQLKQAIAEHNNTLANFQSPDNEKKIKEIKQESSKQQSDFILSVPQVIAEAYTRGALCGDCNLNITADYFENLSWRHNAIKYLYSISTNCEFSIYNYKDPKQIAQSRLLQRTKKHVLKEHLHKTADQLKQQLIDLEEQKLLLTSHLQNVTNLEKLIAQSEVLCEVCGVDNWKQKCQNSKCNFKTCSNKSCNKTHSVLCSLDCGNTVCVGLTKQQCARYYCKQDFKSICDDCYVKCMECDASDVYCKRCTVQCAVGNGHDAEAGYLCSLCIKECIECNLNLCSEHSVKCDYGKCDKYLCAALNQCNTNRSVCYNNCRNHVCSDCNNSNKCSSRNCPMRQKGECIVCQELEEFCCENDGCNLNCEEILCSECRESHADHCSL